MFAIEKSWLKTYHADSFSLNWRLFLDIWRENCKKICISVTQIWRLFCLSASTTSKYFLFLTLLCRFDKHHFVRLVNGLRLPDFYVCQQRTVCPGMEALLILLRRLTYPNRWCELTHMFGRPEPELSMIFNEVSVLCLKCPYWVSFFQLTEIIFMLIVFFMKFLDSYRHSWEIW